MKTFSERLADAVRQGELASAIAHLLIKGDDSHFTDELLQGDIELDCVTLFEHIEAIKKRTPKSTW